MNTYRHPDFFIDRHNGPGQSEQTEMLKALGYSQLDQLIDNTVPAHIRLPHDLAVGEALSEDEFGKYIKQIASKNTIAKTYIGQGYYPTVTPAVILRNIFENPGWYTQYTPYQAEISQGRLEALFNFQSMVTDLTGLPVANASLLDEATAAAEAMLMLYTYTRTSLKQANTFLVSDLVFPQTIDVLKTRALPFGITIQIVPNNEFVINDSVFAVLAQNPDKNGNVIDLTETISVIKKSETVCCCSHRYYEFTPVKITRRNGR